MIEISALALLETEGAQPIGSGEAGFEDANFF
jgi:hypothetical protein